MSLKSISGPQSIEKPHRMLWMWIYIKKNYKIEKESKIIKY